MAGRERRVVATPREPTGRAVRQRAAVVGAWHPDRALLALQRSVGNQCVQRLVARAETAEEQHTDQAVERGIASSRGGGAALGSDVRADMEQAFGADFSGVRVHTGASAHSLNTALNARAFTTGQDIFFRSGAYNPGGSAGRRLLAHELTHVVQQSGMPQGGPLTVSSPDDVAEHEAERVGAAVTSSPTSEAPEEGRQP